MDFDFLLLFSCAPQKMSEMDETLIMNISGGGSIRCAEMFGFCFVL